MASEPIFDDEGRFYGFDPSKCMGRADPHRTVGAHRAWCHVDSTWCYPTIPCPGCATVMVLEKLALIRESIRLVLVPGIPHDCRGPTCLICVGLSDALDDVDEVRQLLE